MHLRRTPALAGLLLAGLLLAGCTGEAEGDPDAAATDAATTTTSGSPSTTVPEPSVEPATGPLVEEPLFSFRAPEGWESRGDMVLSLSRGESVRPADTFDFSGIDAVAFDRNDIEEPGKATKHLLFEFRAYAQKGIRDLGTTEFAGKPAYHLTGRDQGRLLVHQFGVVHEGKQVNITFYFVDRRTDYRAKLPEYELTPAEQAQIIESVEASWTWR